MSTTASTHNQLIHWHCARFSQLSCEQLYRLIRQRIAVFVVEQQCPFQDLDGKDLDPQTEHLWTEDAQGEPIAYVRLIAPGQSYAEPSIGRVLTAGLGRGSGLGHALMREALRRCRQRWPGQSIRIGAQAHLQDYYRRHGFETASAPYLEDDIPHVEMLCPGTATEHD